MLHRSRYPHPPPTVEYRPSRSAAPSPDVNGPAVFVVVAGRWDDGERNTKLISEPLTLDAALIEYAGCAGYPWRHIEYKGVCLDVLEVCQ